VDFAFGKNVDPAVATTGVERWSWKSVEAVGCISEFGGGERVARWERRG
jgi:hypothetical protein